MIRILKLTVLGLSLSTGTLHAQTGAVPGAAEEVLIRVDVEQVAAELAGELGIAADALPRSVEVPIEVAAAACEIPLDQLEHFRAADESVECKAAMLTDELAAAAREQLEQ
jgi:hypothetical protein